MIDLVLCLNFVKKNMTQHFKITGISYEDTAYLFDLNDEDLKKINARRIIVDKKPGYPCRVSLEDANEGEEVILFSYKHLAKKTPYASFGPVFVRKNARTAQLRENEIPVMLDHRSLSLRAYDHETMMIDARTIHGSDLRKTLQEIFLNKNVEFVQIHNSGPGCYNCTAVRCS